MKIKKYLRNTGILLGAVLGLHFLNYAWMVGAQNICSRFSQRIETREQAQEVLQRESLRLGIPSEKQIHLVLDKREGSFSGASRVWKNIYRIDLTPSCFNESALVHELSHIAKGDVDSWAVSKNKHLRNFKYFFIQEPRATLYQIKRAISQ
ncbi:hypothetical protein FJZ17_01740 [Candidatus Pacearchaeota archaeon]|nr:hypothetical protein [Candidatus Pacearchaeota archaeon]